MRGALYAVSPVEANAEAEVEAEVAAAGRDGDAASSVSPAPTTPIGSEGAPGVFDVGDNIEEGRPEKKSRMCMLNLRRKL